MVSGSPIVAAFARAARQRSQLTQSATAEHSVTAPESSTALQQTESTVSHEIAPKTPAHRLHHVLPIATRRLIVTWMRARVARDGDKHLVSATVKQFPEFFKGSASANHMRARRLWRDRATFPDLSESGIHGVESSSLTRVTNIGLQRTRLKARPGRGRKREAWVNAIHEDLREEFDRLRRLGVKFSLNTLRDLACNILCHSTNESYSMNAVDPRSQQPLHLKIDRRWVQSFMERYRIVSRAHTGKHRASPAKEEDIEVSVAIHLGTVSGLMGSGEMDENNVENADETHFVINVDNGRTLGFCGDTEVKYADVVSGGEGYTMLVRLTGGRDARIAAPFMVFKNVGRHYPIRGVPDNVPGVAYRTGPKGWMDSIVMPQWLSETRVITALPHKRRILYVDNCSGHTQTAALADAAGRINTEIRYFPPNATHLIQPCDSFVIQKIKRAWTTHWEGYKLDCIKRGKWKDSCGKIHNPGKSYFLQLAAKCVREVNQQRDADGISFARKAMIITGLGLNTNGHWEIGQLTPELQRIVRKHQTVFDAARAKAIGS